MACSICSIISRVTLGANHTLCSHRSALVVPQGRDESSKHPASSVWGRYASPIALTAAAGLTDFSSSYAANASPFLCRFGGQIISHVVAGMSCDVTLLHVRAHQGGDEDEISGLDTARRRMPRQKSQRKLAIGPDADICDMLDYDGHAVRTIGRATPNSARPIARSSELSRELQPCAPFLYTYL